MIAIVLCTTLMRNYVSDDRSELKTGAGKKKPTVYAGNAKKKNANIGKARIKTIGTDLCSTGELWTTLGADKRIIESLVIQCRRIGSVENLLGSEGAGVK